MAASKTTVARAADVILKFTNQPKAVDLLTEMSSIKGNDSFQTTINMLLQELRERRDPPALNEEELRLATEYLVRLIDHLRDASYSENFQAFVNASKFVACGGSNHGLDSHDLYEVRGILRGLWEMLATLDTVYAFRLCELLIEKAQEVVDTDE